MCGIAGIILERPQPPDERHVRLLLESLATRGPDDQGILLVAPDGTARRSREWEATEAPVQAMLVHRRLSILDTTEGGRQPMASPDGRYHIAYNGEIYNFHELRTELDQAGHTFGTRSDTEVLLAAWAEWGTAALNRLTGMFAFALIDTHERRLFLVRDFFGIKPLFYSNGHHLAFASRIDPLLGLPGVTRRADPQAVYDYIRHGQSGHGAATPFADIKQVPAAHYLEVPLDEPGRHTLTRYWDIDLDHHLDISYEDAAVQLRQRFLDAVGVHLRSDVPVGLALSGGIDSSAITMCARHVQGPDAQLHTFSYIASTPRLSEERYVDIVNKAAGTVPHKTRTDAMDLLEDLEALLAAQGQPFGGTSIYAQFQVFRMAHAAGIKVVLDGQGADELMGGYRPFLAARFASLVRRGRPIKAARFLRHAARQPGVTIGSVLREAAAFLLPPRLQTPLRALAHETAYPKWLDASWFRPHSLTTGPIHHTRGREVLRTHMARTLTHTILPHLLRYDDSNSMAHSVESRVPFLTPDLVTFLLALPEEYLVDDHAQSKSLFRAAMRGLVPDAILDRQDKIGFATPERDWLLELSPLVDMVFKSHWAARTAPLDMDHIRREWADVKAGKRPLDGRIWRAMNLILWTKTFEVEYAEAERAPTTRRAEPQPVQEPMVAVHAAPHGAAARGA